MSEQFNVYIKYQRAKKMLLDKHIEPSGKNKFSGYTYFELSDFIPHLIGILCDLKLATIVSYSTDTATLIIVDSENPDQQIIFTSPMSKAELKGCHEVQNLGAVQTYERRYLYMTAFDITDSDLLDDNPIDQAVYCDDCDKEIKPAKNANGTQLSVSEIVNKGKKEFKKQLCISCFGQRKKRLDDEVTKRVVGEK